MKEVHSNERNSRKPMVNMDLLELGDNIRNQREFLGISQEELALEIGTSKGTISLYESGQMAMKVDRLFEIADALFVTPLAQDIRCQSPLQKSYNYEKILNNIVIYDTIRKKMERGIQTQWLEEMIMKQKKKLERSG